MIEDADHDIHVYLSDDDDPYCICIRIYDALIHLHGRSAIDLNAKLSKVILELTSVEALAWLMESDPEMAEKLGGMVEKTPLNVDIHTRVVHHAMRKRKKR